MAACEVHDWRYRDIEMRYACRRCRATVDLVRVIDLPAGEPVGYALDRLANAVVC